MMPPEPVILPLPRQQPRLDLSQLRLECSRFFHQVYLLRHWWLAPHRPYQPFFLVAAARTGSNLLVDYLNQLAGVQCFSEILNWRSPIAPRLRTSPEGAILHVKRWLQTVRTPQRGCKLFFNHLQDFRLSIAHVDAAFPSAKYIVLYREALAEQFVSLQLARLTQQWLLLPGEQQKQVPVIVDPTELRRFCQSVRQEYQEVLTHRAIRERSIVLSYEELTEDPVGCLRDQVCSLLEVPAVEPQATLRKQNPQPLSQRVANYSEIAAFVLSPLSRQRYGLPRRRQFQRRAA